MMFPGILEAAAIPLPRKMDAYPKYPAIIMNSEAVAAMRYDALLGSLLMKDLKISTAARAIRPFIRNVPGA